MIRAWAGGLCALAVAAAMVRILAPDGSMNKMLKLILGAMMLCAMIGPLIKAVPEGISALQQVPEMPVPSEFTGTVQSQMQRAASQQAQTVAEAVLKNNDISFEKVEVQMDISQPGSIKISSVTVKLLDVTQKARAVSVLQEALGAAVEVKISG